MLNEIIKNDRFCDLMSRHCAQIIEYLFDQGCFFGVLCPIETVQFDPVLPEHIRSHFRPYTLFFLADYTFESAHIKEEELVFEAGFGSENIGSVVSIPLFAIMQIIVDETPIFINIAAATKKRTQTKQQGNLKSSMEALLSNPENIKLLKKKKK